MWKIIPLHNEVQIFSIMSNTLKSYRLDLLINGYAREDSYLNDCFPVDIIEIASSFFWDNVPKIYHIDCQVKSNVNPETHDFEIYMDKTVCSVINTHYYKLLLYRKNKNTYTKYTINKSDIFYKTKNIYDYENCISFISVKCGLRSYYYQIISMDANDNVIGNTELKSWDQFLPVNAAHLHSAYTAKYFNSRFDINNQGYVYIDQWISTLQSHYNISNELIFDFKALFYYIQFKKAHMTCLHIYASIITCEDFTTWISSKYYTSIKYRQMCRCICLGNAYAYKLLAI
eukprot:113412_1